MTEQFGKFSPEVGIGLGRSEIIDRIYEVAVEPERFENLVDSWEKCIGPFRHLHGAHDGPVFHDPEIEAHFTRATVILDRLPQDNADAAREVLKKFETTAAVIVDPKMKIRVANPAAETVFSIFPGAGFAAFGLDEYDQSRLANAVSEVQNDKTSDTQLLRFRTPDDRIILFQIRGFQSAEGERFALLVTSELGWPENLDKALKSGFNLTNAEVLVLRGLVECQTPKSIAEARNRSLDTIRSQIQSILTKTETHSQTELVRITLALMDVITSTTDDDDGQISLNEGHGGLEFCPQFPISRPGGRKISHLILGDPRGRPVLFLPVRYGMIRWPASAEARARAMGLKIIVPIRAGYGDSDPIAAGADYVDATIDDHVAVMDHFKIQSCPIISMNNDGFIAFTIAARNPGRVSAIINCSGVMPYTKPEQYERMDKWYRFMTANAKFAPHLVPFMVKAGFYMAKRRGKEAFFRSVYENNPVDLAVITQPEVKEALMAGSDIALANIDTAYRAYAEEAIAHAHYDWGADAEAIRDTVPVHFMNGLKDHTVPPETLAEFQEEHDWITYHIYPQSGQLIMLKHWKDVLDLTAKFA